MFVKSPHHRRTTRRLHANHLRPFARAAPSPTLPAPQMSSTFQSIPPRRRSDKTPHPDIPIRAAPPARTPSFSCLQSERVLSTLKYRTSLPSLSAPPPSARNPKSIRLLPPLPPHTFSLPLTSLPPPLS